MQSLSRGRLMAGAALGLGLSLVAPQQAMAACVPSANAYTCPVGTTTTTDTTGTNPTDRNGPFTAATIPIFVNIPAGAIVNGYGLAATESGVGVEDVTVTNNGLVQVNAGNTPSAGGTGALDISVTGATDLIYLGAGDVLNLGNGNGLSLDTTGTGTITATVGGNIRSGAGAYPSGGVGILLSDTGVGGNMAVTTTAGKTINADWAGIAVVGNGTGTGTLTVTNNASIGSLAGAPNTLDHGIIVDNNAGTGAVSVANNGAIGTAADRTTTTGIEAYL
jgi:hypothetical protein